MVDEMLQLKSNIDDTLAEAKIIQITISEVKTNLGDQRIPKSVTLRQNEIQAFQDELDQIKDQFKELQEHETNDKNDKQTIDKLSLKLTEFVQMDVKLENYQANNLKILDQENLLDLTKSIELIPEIKTHKDNITNAKESLKVFGELIQSTYT